jgi:hypothetical protein
MREAWQAMLDAIEINVKGKWTKVPALHIDGNTIVIRGKWIKRAVIHDEAWLETELKDPELCVKTLNEIRTDEFRPDIFTFTQMLSYRDPKYDYYTEWDSIAAIHLTNFKDWWEELPQETRKNVRRSQKRGVVVKIKNLDDDLLAGIRNVNNDSPVRQGGRNLYFGRSLEQLKKDYSSFLDRSDFICTYVGDELIGFLKLVYRKQIASILNLTTKLSHSDKRPANALVAKAVELCESKGISFITFGMLDYGNKRYSSLREFKLRSGFKEILAPRYYVPLTPWGEFCMKAKFHRGLLGIIPSRAIRLGIHMRTKWHSFTFRQAGVAQR